MLRLRYLVPLAALALALPTAASQAQQPASFDFTIKNIMRGPEVYGREPSNIRWTADGRWIYFMWNEPGTGWRAPMAQYRVHAEPGAKPEKVAGQLADSIALALASGVRSPDRTRELITSGGDLYERTIATGARWKVSRYLRSLAASPSSAFRRSVMSTNMICVAGSPYQSMTQDFCSVHSSLPSLRTARATKLRTDVSPFWRDAMKSACRCRSVG